MKSPADSKQPFQDRFIDATVYVVFATCVVSMLSSAVIALSVAIRTLRRVFS